MVSSINSVRVWTQQVALKAFNEAAAERGGDASGPAGSLADRLGARLPGDGEDSDLSALIAMLRQQAMTGGAKPAEDEAQDGAVDDISSDAFMKALQRKIETLAANPDTKAMAELMQKALAAGTLTITDAEGGKQIVGRDVTDGKEGSDKPGTPNPSPTVTTIETSDWSDYLKDHLKRDTSGKYERNEDSSHIDKVSGASSYFGMIGDTYYYLSWIDPKDAMTIQI
jgi:hypothetical protein